MPSAALEHTGGGAAQKFLRKTSLLLDKPQAGLAGGLLMFAQPVQQQLLDKRRHQDIQRVPNKAPDEYRQD